MNFRPAELQHYPLDLDELPGGWAVANVAAVSESVQPGFPSGKHNQEGRGIPHLRPMNISREGSIDLSDVKYVEGRPANRLSDGDVLFNNTNSPALVGKTAVVRHPQDWAFSNHMTRIHPAAGIDPAYLAHHLHYLWVCGYFRHRCVNHVNQASISSGPLSTTVPLAIAPSQEQHRIVAAIEEQFSRIDSGVAALDRVRANLKRMRAAVLQTAVTGRLVPNNPGEPSLAGPIGSGMLLEPLLPDQPANWVTTTIGSVAHVTSGATPSRARKDYWAEGSIPWVTSALVNAGIITRAQEYVTPLALQETPIKLMPPGTLLLAMYGEGQTRGRCSELQIEATTNQACASIVLHNGVEFVRPYLKLILTASYEANRRLSAGGVQPNLSVGIIKGLRIALPPADEQVQICNEAARQLSLIARVEANLEVDLHRSHRLHDSILAAAFSGRLAPQDPNDEPASALLTRIAAEEVESTRGRPAPIRKAITPRARRKG